MPSPINNEAESTLWLINIEKVFAPFHLSLRGEKVSSRSPEPVPSVVIDPAVLIEPAVSALPLLIGVLEQRLMCSLGRMSLIVGRPIFSESKHVFAAMPAPALSAASTPRLSRRGAVMVIAWNVVIALISPVQFRSDPRQSGQRIFV